MDHFHNKISVQRSFAVKFTLSIKEFTFVCVFALKYMTEEIRDSNLKIKKAVNLQLMKEFLVQAYLY